MKALAIVYSVTGNNEKLAAVLRDRIGCDVVKLETAKKRNGFSIFLDIMFNRQPPLKPIGCSINNYDHIILLSPIWAGRIAMPLMSFLKSKGKEIKHYSFITVCGGGTSSQKDKILHQLTTIVGHAPVKVMELWTKTVMDVRKRAGAAGTTATIEQGDFECFKNELDSFIEALGVHDQVHSF